MRTQQQDTPARTITISGQVSSTGAITAGTGFIITKGGTGTYTISFSPMRAVLAVTVTCIGVGYANATPSSARLISVGVYNTAGAAADMAWQFTITGIAL